jgi:tripartite-type tricarboxylate transporter receptor subunit TctC
MRAHAAAGRTPIEPLPDVPTVAESGFNDHDVDLWCGLVAPAKTPKDKIAQFADWLIGAVPRPEVRGKLFAVEPFPVGKCGADFATHTSNQSEEYDRIIR